MGTTIDYDELPPPPRYAPFNIGAFAADITQALKVGKPVRVDERINPRNSALRRELNSIARTHGCVLRFDRPEGAVNSRVTTERDATIIIFPPTKTTKKKASKS